MNDNPFEIKEEACASSPDHRRYLLIQAVDTETGEIVWAVGDAMASFFPIRALSKVDLPDLGRPTRVTNPDLNVFGSIVL